MIPVYGLLGHPVARSRSPAMHQAWLRAADLPGTYLAFQVDPALPERGRRAIDAVRTLGLAGVNLTIPLKTDVLPHLDTLDPLAAQVGAVNTVVPRGDGLHGLNTDVHGFRVELRGLVGQRRGPAVVLGAGGAARAVVVGLLLEGFTEIRVLNRTLARAEELTGALQDGRAALMAGPLEALPGAVGSAALVVSTVGGAGAGAVAALPVEGLSAGSVWMDLDCWSPEAPHVRALAERGVRVGRGREMLVHQGALAFRAFTGVMPDPAVGRAAVAASGSGSR